MKKVIFTPDGHRKIQAEYDDLKKRRVGAVSELKTARELGDLSENAAYKVARQKLNSIDHRIMSLSRLLRNAEVVESKRDGTVDIGSTVVVESDTGRQTFHIVGGYESDPMNGKISVFSPIGKALMAKKAGDDVTAYVPNGLVKYVVISVS